ncbi:YhfG family protein [Motilimonas cestriensis]|uniref:YhfG family protein n=1 Tax=Motilimonas cestriensis TaxID=2742685 RepID=A0ABS8W6Q0_9GAMM|nr:YhfG family protein [Motilimonas cestriensis]MCE2593772.1 YhfG family protein [Motilimonas cestriensis]
MKYELLVLAAMTRLESPNTQAIVAATGISERKVQSVVHSLVENLGLDIQRERQGRTFRFTINSWGVFESGQAIQSQLNAIDLVMPHRSLISTYEEKHAYFEKVKMNNFRESTRLEGHDVASDLDPSLNREQQRQMLIEKYSNVSSLAALNDR